MTRLALTLCIGLILLATSIRPAMAAPDPTPEEFARELATLVNGYRAQYGLAPLRPSAMLDEIAGSHSVDMAAQRQLTHAGFRDRYEQTGSPICVENLARNFATPDAVLRGWQQSPGHDRNLLEPKVTRMGIAINSRYVTFFACR